MKHYIEEHKSKLVRLILDEVEAKKVASLNLKIIATHAGRINGNYVFYTPRSMENGIESLTFPFKKHLQEGHNGKAIGVITDASYVDISQKYPELAPIYDEIQAAETPEALVGAVKKLVAHPIAKEDNFEGLGLTEIKAVLYNPDSIQELVSGENKGKVSIGGESDSVLCSVCAAPFRQNHRHKRGSYYNDELCFAIYDKMSLDHVGFVNDPADTDTTTTILDSKESNNDSSITVETYEIKDNKQGTNKGMKKYTLQEMLEVAKSTESLAKVYTEASEDQLKVIQAQLAEIKPTSDSSFLFTEDKVLPINSQLGVATAKLLIEQLDESVEEKSMLVDLINTQIGLHFDGIDMDEYVKTLTTPEANPSDTAGFTAMGDGTTKEAAAALSAEVVELMVQKVGEIVAEKIKELTPAPIQDNIQNKDSYDILIKRNKALESDVRLIQDSVDALTTDLREIIIEQILEKKGLDRESEYFVKVLAGRDIDQLKSTLEDLKYGSTSTVAQPAASTPDEDKTLEKTNISDSLDKEKASEASTSDKTGEGDEPQTIKDSKNLTKSELIKKYGYARAVQLLKKSK